jgi:hypothetical protein
MSQVAGGSRLLGEWISIGLSAGAIPRDVAIDSVQAHHGR